MGIGHLVPPWIASLAPYVPGKPIEEVEREYGIAGSAKLASNENPLGASPKAIAAVRGALEGLHRYPDGSGYHLKRAIAAKHGVTPAEVVIGNGSNEVLELLARVFLRPGDEAVMADQAFIVYPIVVQALGGLARKVPLRDLTHDLEAMADAIGPATRLVFLANPNNPTGTIVRREVFERFLERVPRNVVVVSDDAYAEYVEDPEYPDSLRYHAPDRLLVTTRTFSKIYGLAGLRVGYGIAPAEVVAMLDRIREPFNVSTLAQVAAIAALDDDEHVERCRRQNTSERARLTQALEGLGVAVVPSEANFVLVDVGDAPAITEALLRRGVIVRPMGVYGLLHHVRVTVGTPEENDRFLEALAAVRSEAGSGAAEGVPR